MAVSRYTIIFCFLTFISCSKTKVTITTNTKEKTRTKIETTDFGSGGSITGTGPNFVKYKMTKYDSLDQIIYESYKETSYGGCIGNTERWKVSAKTPTGETNELELIENNQLKLTYKDKKGKIDSNKVIPISDLHQIDWIDQADW